MHNIYQYGISIDYEAEDVIDQQFAAHRKIRFEGCNRWPSLMVIWNGYVMQLN